MPKISFPSVDFSFHHHFHGVDDLCDQNYADDLVTQLKISFSYHQLSWHFPIMCPVKYNLHDHHAQHGHHDHDHQSYPNHFHHNEHPYIQH